LEQVSAFIGIRRVAVATHKLETGTLNVTNETSPGGAMRFWRAVWQP